ncbi:MAG: nucleotidyltransferase domain-containing protein [Thermoplasmata archaeon]|nr:nucleotidyltransferase domain-containing protein [Thermoplasmata archaeon]
MFTVEDRTRARERILEKARSDGRIVAAAVVGSAAGNEEDRWSDLDLTFGVAEGVAVGPVLSEWTRDLSTLLRAVPLFDLPYRATIYRVFLLPGNLQVDLSFTPAAEFGALGPKFTLLFGKAVQRNPSPPPSISHRTGLAVHHAVRARASIERGRPWQAEHWIQGLRNEALSIACMMRGLDSGNARGFDRLPQEVRTMAVYSRVSAFEREELLRALAASIELLIKEGGVELAKLDSRLVRELRELSTA